MSIDTTPMPASPPTEGQLVPESANSERVISQPEKPTVTPEAQTLLTIAEAGKHLDEPEDGLRQIANANMDVEESEDLGLERDNDSSTKGEQQLSPEQKAKLLGEAMGEFRGVLDGFTQLRSADTTFAEGVGRAANRIANLANSGEYRRDTLARPIDQLATQFGSEMAIKVRQIGQQAEQMGLKRGESEGEMDGLLKQIASTEDPVQKAQLIQKSVLIFQQIAQPIEQARQEKRGQRRVLQQQAEQNTTIARRKNGEASLITRLDDRSAPVVYERHSRGLTRLLTEGNQAVSSIENVVISNNRRHQEHFMQAMRRLSGQNEHVSEIQTPS